MTKILLTGSSSFTGTKFIDLYGDKFDIAEVSRDHPTDPVDLQDAAAVQNFFKKVQPDIIVHLAATIGRDAGNADVLKVDVAATKTLVDLAKTRNIPFIYTSSEIVYDGKPEGMYEEDDEYHPRSSYGESKVISEEYIKASGLPYLITRGHRYVGFPSKRFNRPKQFPDALKDLMSGKEVHLDSKRKVTLILIDDICDAIYHHICHNLDKQILINVGMEKVTTYYDFWIDIAKTAGIDLSLLHDDGDEPGWLLNNTLSTARLRRLGYPQRSYEEIVRLIAENIRRASKKV